ncbi:hypothetical protein SAV31267_069070 [Streptomyces avermitilis]|uniref:Peptidase S26 domain-containing protein n=1 Tax=Streptomyces avermitilis TaxID=33903 RepID=A0A4D4MYZ0_STRAX|nr:hypothetical protein SAV31267_069070 [Streptomyces avermitilis]
MEDAATSASDSGDGDGGGTRESGEQGGQPKKQRSFWKELPLLIGIALILALLIKTFLVQAFSIPSDSMQNTLQQGDRVLVDKLTPGSARSPSAARSSSSTTPPTGWRASRRPPRTPCSGSSAGSA